MKIIFKTVKTLIILLIIAIILTVVLYGHADIPLEELKAKYGNEHSQFMPLDGMEVHYRDEGNKQDSLHIILIHGTGASLHTFNDWAASLKENHRVIRMDLPAYGLTGPFPDSNYNIAHYVDFLNGFLTQLRIDQCIIAGNSLGGQIAWRYTAAYPNKVSKLILIDAAGYTIKSKSVPLAFKAARIPVIKNLFTYITPRFIAKASVENVYYDKSKVTEELVDQYFELTLRKGNRKAFVDRLSATYDTTIVSLIKAIQQPTLVLWGKQDELIPLYMAEQFHQDLPNDTLVILDKAGHVPMEEIPKRSLEVVREFLEN